MLGFSGFAAKERRGYWFAPFRSKHPGEGRRSGS